jgi:branched-chain amino acid transport system substrate-binding protein
VTGNWGNDLTLLVKSAREVGLKASFFTFYGNALGAPAAIGEAGVGAVYAVAEWHPNVGGAASDAFYAAFRERFPAPRDDYVHWRMHVMIEMLAAAIERAGSAEALGVLRALEGARHAGAVQSATMRAADHQLHQPLVVSVMERAGTPGVKHDVEGSGFGFRTVRRFEAIELPTACKMVRPDA